MRRLLQREKTSQNYGQIMVHESLPTATKYAFGSHPRRVFSISYQITGFFHGGNTGSNPVGDANFRTYPLFGHDRVTIQPDFLSG